MEDERELREITLNLNDVSHSSVENEENISGRSSSSLSSILMVLSGT